MESKIRTPNPPPSRSRSRSERKPREQGDELIARTSSLISNYRAFDLFTTAAGEEDLRKVLAQWREETDESKRSSDAWDILNAYFESAPFVCVDREREGVDGGAVERFAHYVNVMQMLKEFIHSVMFVDTAKYFPEKVTKTLGRVPYFVALSRLQEVHKELQKEFLSVLEDLNKGSEELKSISAITSAYYHLRESDRATVRWSLGMDRTFKHCYCRERIASRRPGRKLVQKDTSDDALQLSSALRELRADAEDLDSQLRKMTHERNAWKRSFSLYRGLIGEHLLLSQQRVADTLEMFVSISSLERSAKNPSKCPCIKKLIKFERVFQSDSVNEALSREGVFRTKYKNLLSNLSLILDVETGDTHSATEVEVMRALKRVIKGYAEMQIKMESQASLLAAKEETSKADQDRSELDEAYIKKLETRIAELEDQLADAILASKKSSRKAKNTEKMHVAVLTLYKKKLKDANEAGANDNDDKDSKADERGAGKTIKSALRAYSRFKVGGVAALAGRRAEVATQTSESSFDEGKKPKKRSRGGRKGMVGQEFGLSGILGKTKTLAGYVKMPPLINIGILIAHIYHGKIIQDRTDDKRMKSREPVPNFLYNFLIRQYGLKNIATKHLHGLARAMTKYRVDSKRIDVFAKLIGLSENDKFVSLACDFLLFVLRLALRCEHDEDLGDGRVKHLLGDSVTKPHFVASELCVSTAQLAFQNFAAHDETANETPGLNELTETLMSKEQWNVDDFLGLVMDLWYNVFDKELKALKLKFQQYDANADGTLNFDEFVTVTKRLFPSLARNFSQREMTELYSSFSGDDGVISEEEFFIAIQRLFRESVSLANISASTSVEDKLKSLATGVSGTTSGLAQRKEYSAGDEKAPLFSINMRERTEGK